MCHSNFHRTGVIISNLNTERKKKKKKRRNSNKPIKSRSGNLKKKTNINRKQRKYKKINPNIFVVTSMSVLTLTIQRQRLSAWSKKISKSTSKTNNN